MNFVKNEILQMWILWKMRFLKCELGEERDFDIVIFFQIQRLHFAEKWEFQYFWKIGISHSFAGDVKPSDISASNEDIITALEALSAGGGSKNRKSPRPTSVPFNKSFLSDTTAKVRGES